MPSAYDNGTVPLGCDHGRAVTTVREPDTVSTGMRPWPCKCEHGREGVRVRADMPMAVQVRAYLQMCAYMQEVPAPPPVCRICVTWLARDLRGRSLVSPDLGSDSLELADCMVDPRKTYGEMAWLWGSAKTYGEMRQACGRMGKPRYRMGRWPVYGKPWNRMGSRKNVWEMPQGMGNGVGVWEAARPYGEPKSH